MGIIIHYLSIIYPLEKEIPNPCILKFRSRKGRSRKTAEGEVQHRLFNILLWNTSILEVRDEHVK